MFCLENVTTNLQLRVDFIRKQDKRFQKWGSFDVLQSQVNFVTKQDSFFELQRGDVVLQRMAVILK